MSEIIATKDALIRCIQRESEMLVAIEAVLATADAKDQPTTSKNIPVALIERLREVSR